MGTDWQGPPSLLVLILEGVWKATREKKKSINSLLQLWTLWTVIITSVARCAHECNNGGNVLVCGRKHLDTIKQEPMVKKLTGFREELLLFCGVKQHQIAFWVHLSLLMDSVRPHQRCLCGLWLTQKLTISQRAEKMSVGAQSEMGHLDHLPPTRLKNLSHPFYSRRREDCRSQRSETTKAKWLVCDWKRPLQS